MALEDSKSNIYLTSPSEKKGVLPTLAHNKQFVCPGDEIITSESVVRGHGTAVQSTKLTSTVAGIVERVNKLVAVLPLRARYSAEVGDVVVGRIRDIVSRRWKVDVNARQDAILLLSAVNLPGGVQRRRTYEDELKMREFFDQDDLISAEVQELKQDGLIVLHTRSLKYGKLENGVFISVSPQLVKRSKKHFHHLPCGVDIILGNNGYIWIYHASGDSEEAEEHMSGVEPENVETDISLEKRQVVVRIRNSIKVLSLQFVSIQPETIMQVYNESIWRNIPLQHMLRSNVMDEITKTIQSG